MNHPLAIDSPAVRAGSRTRPRQVLHLINGEHYSGAERVQDLLGHRLPQSGFAASFACLKPGKFAASRTSRECPLFEIPMKRRYDRRAIGELVELVSQHNFEILHAHTPRSFLAASEVARKTGLPLVYHVHSPAGRDSTRRWSNWINRLAESWASRRVDHFICVSDSLVQYMTELGYPREKISMVANGVPEVHDAPDRQPPANPWTIGTTALFRPRKGIEVLLRAIASLHSSGTKVQLLAVGPFETPGYETEIRDLTRNLGIDHCVEWTGFTRNVNQYFQNMDLFVLPSLFGEGLPMVILEAMANGVPVVAAQVEGIPQAVRDGVDGRLFVPGQHDELADRIREFVTGQHDWQTMSKSARSRQKECFSDSSMARGVARVYERVLGG